MKKTSLAICVATCLILVAASAVAAGAAGSPASVTARADIQPSQTILSFSGLAPGPGGEPPAALHRLVALPPGATGCEVELLAGQAGRVHVTGGVKMLRGVPVVSVLVEDPVPGELRLAVRHDGLWGSSGPRPGCRPSPRLTAALCGSVLGLAASDNGADGSYVIICPPEYADAAADLAEWKRRKGIPSVVATTDVIGTSNVAILAYLQDAYNNWPAPPQYVVLIGDIDDIPAWSISQNLTDQPYACLDGDDWIPDVMLGRFSVESSFQAETVVAKTIGYERSPYLALPTWFNSSLVVGANYPAVTPVSTVRWCGEQLETLGFYPAEVITYDPYDPGTPNIWDGTVPITNALEAGVSMVMYRGWAYGVYGWEPPHFTTAEIPGVENGAMNPIVLSFVCDTGNFAHDNACMGEVFLRVGNPTQPKGAVAFFGNTEFWSHTRYNDALAISFFERVVDPAITDLGAWILAGKLRFMDFFPLELEAEEGDEESVEFYFNIYNLFGDPELNFWKAVPTALVVTHDGVVAPGANLLEVQVHEADGITPLAGARVGLVQGETLLAGGFTASGGLARLGLATPPEAGQPVAITVTHPDRIPYEGVLTVGDGSAAYLVAAGHVLDGDGLANPGETVEITVTVGNRGTTAASAVTGNLTVVGPATVTTGTAAFPDVGGGQEVDSATPFVCQMDPDAPDGAKLRFLLDTLHDGGASDDSQFELAIMAPAFTVAGVTVDPDGHVGPGEQVTLWLTLRNDGSAATTGGTATLQLDTPGVGTLLDNTTVFTAVDPDSTVDTSADTFGLQVDGDVPVGTGLAFTLQVTTSEGYVSDSNFSLVVGNEDIGAPVGPDTYGYYAYDSADINYPGQRPVYRWRELSPTYGGAGTEIPFIIDGFVQVVALPFPFQYYGQTFTEIRVSDNGLIAFDTTGENDFYNWPIPSPHGDHSIVAPFWDNLHPDPEDEDRPRPDGVFYYHDVAAGTFTIEWSRVSHYRPEIDDLQTFQVVLRDVAIPPHGDGEILFLYKQVNNNDHLRTFATVGIESPDEDDGLQLTYSNVYTDGAAPLCPGLAIKFTTAEPVYTRYALASFAAASTPGGLRLSWTPADDRPVLGWLVSRLDGDNVLPLTPEPLPATARNFLDAGATGDESPAYLLTALHPFGQVTELGPLTAAAVAGGPSSVSLLPCWPNPVSGSTRIGFALPRAAPVRLRIYDLAGRLVRTLRDGLAPSGPDFEIWDGLDDLGRPASGGVYLFRLETLGEIRTQKLLLVR